MVLQVLGEKDDGHPTVAKLSLDPVSIAERRRELLEEFHGPGLRTPLAHVDRHGDGRRRRGRRR